MNKFSKEEWEIRVRQRSERHLKKRIQKSFGQSHRVERQNTGVPGCQSSQYLKEQSPAQGQIEPSTQCLSAFSLEVSVEFLSSTG